MADRHFELSGSIDADPRGYFLVAMALICIALGLAAYGLNRIATALEAKETKDAR